MKRSRRYNACKFGNEKVARRWCLAILAYCLCGLWGPHVFAQAASPASQPRPQTRALRVAEGAITVDGRLTEPAWALVPAASGFRQREPFDGPPATEDTQVQVAYDDANLYIGIRAHDRFAEHIVSRIRERDQVMVDRGEAFGFASDDAVAVLLDPFLDGRNAMLFATNPNGAEFDALITDESGSFNQNWRTVFSVAATRDDGGYSVEFAIPFRSLRYPANSGPQTWGFNVARVVRRLHEETLWSAWSRVDGGLARVSRAGTLQGLEALPRFPINLEVKPYALLGRDQARADADAQLVGNTQTQVGLDAKWEAKPGLVLDATVNPDFSQAELDQLRVNLSRFALFYPEKREFFLENAGVFDFGTYGYYDEAPPYLMFFSRRIGAADPETGQGPTPVRGGLRLSGRVGQQTVGAMTMVTQGSVAGQPSQPLTNHAVLRWKRDVTTKRGNGYVGFMLTDTRAPWESAPNDAQALSAASTSLGIDGGAFFGDSTRLSSFYARNVVINEQGLQGATQALDAANDAYRVAVEHDDGRWKLLAEATTLGSRVRAGSGFVPRPDMRRFAAYGGPTFRPRVLGLRKLTIAAGPWVLTGHDWRKQDLWVGGDLTLEWNSNDTFTLTGALGHNVADAPWLVSARVGVPAGDYDYKQSQVVFASNPSRRLSVVLLNNVEWMWGGRFWQASAGVNVVWGGRLSTGASVTRVDVDVPAGKLLSYVNELRVSLPLTTRWVFSFYGQHRQLDDRIALYGRMVYTWRPGSDVFLVVADERGFDGVPGRLAQQNLVAKISYLARLF
ncbi:MAG: DUF5916 domain-containing protein [Deltaproteobacteria bacterium]|nr:DUF5916 domain-containing protein [Deltaproteobacteria bacterium]